MNYKEFLERVINEGIEAAKKHYAKPEQKEKLAGSIAGFEDCRGRTPEELLWLVGESEKRTAEAYRKNPREYWKTRCFELEVEWVCNVVSAMLVNEGRKPILPQFPTARAVLKAAEILGTKGVAA